MNLNICLDSYNHRNIYSETEDIFYYNQMSARMKSIMFEIFLVGYVVSYLKEPRPDEGAEEEDKYLHAVSKLFSAIKLIINVYP